MANNETVNSGHNFDKIKELIGEALRETTQLEAQRKELNEEKDLFDELPNRVERAASEAMTKEGEKE